MSKWPIVKLGEVVRYRKEFITIVDTHQYMRPRVQTRTRGIVLRDCVFGSEIKTKKQQICKAGDFLVAEIDAKVGGVGLVPKILAGAIVSSHYFLFEPLAERLYGPFLDYYIRTDNFISQINAQGSTNYAAIRPYDVLEYEIPLPPVEEQQRIVAHVDAIAERISEVQKLRLNVVQEIEDLCRCLLFSGAEDKLVPMHELVSLRMPDVVVAPNESYSFAGVYSFGRGVFKSQKKTGAEFAYQKLTRLRCGDFIYPKLMAWEGAFGIVPQECDGCVVSPEFPVFTPTKIASEILDVYFTTPRIWSEISKESTGTNVRRRRLNPKDFLAH